ncbi:hypothetical protein [Novosphingobium sp. M1R2S20]|uniref:Transposase n=1 Tax=Novosphingobium rhizovicinum TaxID=3228928 RepID=A0ABV3R8Q0_9SPHN
MVRAVEEGSSARDAAARFEVSASAVIKLASAAARMPHKQAGHYESNRSNPSRQNAVVKGEFSNRGAFVKPCSIYYARVTVLYAVGIGRRNIWSAPEA